MSNNMKNKNNHLPAVACMQGRIGQRGPVVIRGGCQRTIVGSDVAERGQQGQGRRSTSLQRVDIPNVAPTDTRVIQKAQACPASNPRIDCEDSKTVAPSLQEPWQHSQAKQHLAARLQDPLDEIHNMTPEEIYNSSPLYKVFKKATFKRNCRTLKSNIMRLRDLVEFDRQAIANLPARPLMTERGYPFWDGSEAKRILQSDIAHGKIVGLKPKEVYAQNIEYQKFPLHVFRNHFYKIQSSQKSSAYWQLKRNKDAMRSYDEALQGAKYGSPP